MRKRPDEKITQVVKSIVDVASLPSVAQRALNLLRKQGLSHSDAEGEGMPAALADVIATECPTCHSGLEMHQIRAEKRFGIETRVKILYFTQLLGLALGVSPRKLGVHENISDSLGLLKEAGLA